MLTRHEISLALAAVIYPLLVFVTVGSTTSTAAATTLAPFPVTTALDVCGLSCVPVTVPPLSTTGGPITVPPVTAAPPTLGPVITTGGSVTTVPPTLGPVITTGGAVTVTTGGAVTVAPTTLAPSTAASTAGVYTTGTADSTTAAATTAGSGTTDVADATTATATTAGSDTTAATDSVACPEVYLITGITCNRDEHIPEYDEDAKYRKGPMEYPIMCDGLYKYTECIKTIKDKMGHCVEGWETPYLSDFYGLHPFNMYWSSNGSDGRHWRIYHDAAQTEHATSASVGKDELVCPHLAHKWTSYFGDHGHATPEIQPQGKVQWFEPKFPEETEFGFLECESGYQGIFDPVVCEGIAAAYSSRYYDFVFDEGDPKFPKGCSVQGVNQQGDVQKAYILFNNYTGDDPGGIGHHNDAAPVCWKVGGEGEGEVAEDKAIVMMGTVPTADARRLQVVNCDGSCSYCNPDTSTCQAQPADTCGLACSLQADCTGSCSICNHGTCAPPTWSTTVPSEIVGYSADTFKGVVADSFVRAFRRQSVLLSKAGIDVRNIHDAISSVSSRRLAATAVEFTLDVVYPDEQATLDAVADINAISSTSLTKKYAEELETAGETPPETLTAVSMDATPPAEQQIVDVVTTTEPPHGVVDACFPGDAVVRVEGRAHTRMADLAVGDSVLVMRRGALVFEPVLSFLHAFRGTDSVHYFALVHARGEIRATPGHLLLTAEGDKSARDFKSGDILMAADADGAIVQSVVLAVRTVRGADAYAPLTASGTIVVENIVASNYASPVALGVRHAVAHALLFPLRAYHALGFQGYAGDSLGEDLHPFLDVAYRKLRLDALHAHLMGSK